MIVKRFLIGIFLLVVAQSCCEDGIQLFSIEDISTSVINQNNLKDLPMDASVAYDNFAIQLEFATKKEGFAKGNCGDDYIFELSNKVTQIEITSNRDFNEDHPAGDLLNEFFYPTDILISCLENGVFLDQEECSTVIYWIQVTGQTLWKI